MSLLITRETDYALRILRGLADRERHTARDLCQREEIPQQFSYKILKKLANAGLVQSMRGVDGGCRLVGDLRATTLYDLMEYMEEDKQIIACMQPNYSCQWVTSHNAHCHVHRTLAELQLSLNVQLRSYTLQFLIFGEE